MYIHFAHFMSRQIVSNLINSIQKQILFFCLVFDRLKSEKSFDKKTICENLVDQIEMYKEDRRVAFFLRNVSTDFEFCIFDISIITNI